MVINNFSLMLFFNFKKCKTFPLSIILNAIRAFKKVQS